MRKNISSIKKKVINHGFNISHSFLNKAINALIPVFILPFMNSNFGLSKVGEYMLGLSITALPVFLSDFGLTIVATKKIAENKMGLHEKEKYISSIIIGKLFLIVFLLIFLFFSLSFFYSNEFLFLVCTIFLSLSIQNLIPYWFFQGVKKNRLITYVNSFSKITYFFLVYFISKYYSNIIIIPILEVVSLTIGLIFSFIILKFKFNIGFKKPSVIFFVSELKFGKSLLTTQLLHWISFSGGLIFLSTQLSADYFGVYSNLSRISYFIIAFFQPLVYSIFPYVVNTFSNNTQNYRSFVSKILSFILILEFLGILLFLAFSNSLSNFFLKGYEMSYNQSLCYYLFFSWAILHILNFSIGHFMYIASGNVNKYEKFYMVATAFYLLTVGITFSYNMEVSIVSSLVVAELVLLFLMIFGRNKQRVYEF